MFLNQVLYAISYPIHSNCLYSNLCCSRPVPHVRWQTQWLQEEDLGWARQLTLQGWLCAVGRCKDTNHCYSIWTYLKSLDIRGIKNVLIFYQNVWPMMKLIMPRSHLDVNLSREIHVRWFSWKRAGHRPHHIEPGTASNCLEVATSHSISQILYSGTSL